MADPDHDGASWYAANSAAAPERGRLSLELDVDVCVIGGGLAGLTAALNMARRGWSVAVLEARRVAWNASGRNAGLVLPGFSADVSSLIGKLGLDTAKRLWALSASGAEAVRQTARTLPGVELEEAGWLHVSRTAADRTLQSAAERLAGELGTPAEVWPAERVRSLLRSTHYFGGLHLPGGFTINPLNYSLGIAAAAEAAGARIFEHTPALEIDPAGVRKRIVTPSARLRAGHVVLAGNVHIGTLRPDLAGTLVELSAYAMVTEPLGARLREAVRFSGAVTDSELGDSDYRVVGGDRLLWADRCTAWQGNPGRYAGKMLSDIARRYPQLGAVKADYAWSGTIGLPVHGMPQIGELSPGVWLASGFGSHGINTAAMAGELVAAAIVDGAQHWRAFDLFDLVWAGGRAGRAAVQSAYWYGRASEQARAWLARRGAGIELEPAEAEAVPDPVTEDAAAAAAAPVKRRKRRRKKAAKQDGDPAAAEPPATPT
jgi:glycine/D-amino acid oxidase-like deaminating enzyme